VLVHTGQHYDANMSAEILADLGLPDPDFHLGIGSGSHAEQTGRVMLAYGEVAAAHRPTGWSSSATSIRRSPARSPA
jgi:UDP-N-acetylglucosamine 2-epimerase (non-hydrolysing)